jgi:hypothetical protein
VALAAGVGLLWHWYAHDTGTLTIIAAVLSFLIALHWGLQYAVLTGRLYVNRSGGITLRKHRGDRQPAVAKDQVNAETGERSPQDARLDAGSQASADKAEAASSGEFPADLKSSEPTASSA